MNPLPNKVPRKSETGPTAEQFYAQCQKQGDNARAEAMMLFFKHMMLGLSEIYLEHKLSQMSFCKLQNSCCNESYNHLGSNSSMFKLNSM